MDEIKRELLSLLFKKAEEKQLHPMTILTISHLFNATVKGIVKRLDPEFELNEEEKIKLNTIVDMDLADLDIMFDAFKKQ